MKKLGLILCGALLLVGMTGCSDATTQVSEKGDVLITVGNEDITKGDVYEGLSSTKDITPVSEALDRAVAKFAVPTTKKIEKEGKETLASYKDSIGKDKWKNHLKTNGYKDEKDFYENSILVNIKKGLITDAYLDKNFDQLVNKYEVRKLQIMVVPTKDKVKEANKALKKKDADFKKIASQYGDTKTHDGSEGVYTNKSGLPSAVWEAIMKTKDKEITQTVEDKTTSNFYIVKVVSSKVDKFKEEAKTAIKGKASADESGLTLDDQAYHYFLLESGYSIHDANVYSALLNSSAKYETD